VLPVPIVSGAPPPTYAAIENGRDCPIYIYDFACFFLQSRVPNGNVNVTGEYVGRCPVGTGKSDPTKSPAGLSGLPGITKLVLFR
jgi:hypothetical protein